MERNNDRHSLPTKKIQKGYIVLIVLLFVIIFVPAVIHKVSRQSASSISAQISDSLLSKEIAYYSDSLHKLQDKRQNNYYTVKNYMRNPSGRNSSYNGTATIISERPSHDTPRHRYHRASAREILHFDLNKADSIDLVQLRGIGPSYARRIIRYREKLGGYANIEQLQEVYGMTEETYRAITPFLSVSSKPYRPLNPNTATLQQLRDHPYLNYYQARAIIDWRTKGHIYTTMDDLHVLSLLDDSTIAKISPYLVF